MNIDIVETGATDLVGNITSLDMVPDEAAEEVRLDAVLEHLFRHERRQALREWHRVLQPGGVLDIRFVPDFQFIADAYVEKREGVTRPTFDLDEVYRYTHGDPVPWNSAEQIHKDVFTADSLRRELEEAGFAEIEVRNVRFGNERHALNLNALARKRG